MKTIFEANKQIIYPVLPLMKLFLLTFVALYFGTILATNSSRYIHLKTTLIYILRKDRYKPNYSTN